jgi:hypothetical protein
MPQINIKCEEKDGDKNRKGVSFIEVQQNITAVNKDSAAQSNKNADLIIDNKDYESFKKVEEMINSISKNVENISEEFRLFKNSFLKTKKNSGKDLIKETFMNPDKDSVNHKMKNEQNHHQKFSDNKPEQQSVIKMKSFTDLQLDLNSLSDKGRRERKNEDFLNLLNSKLKQQTKMETSESNKNKEEKSKNN